MADHHPPPLEDTFFFETYDFEAEFLPSCDLFTDEFSFGPSFDVFDSSTFSFGSDDVSVSFSVESHVQLANFCCQRKKRRLNRVYIKESVLTSCWYQKFLCPGTVRHRTHILSSSDRFREF